MSIQDSIQYNIFREIDYFSYDFDKELEEINLLMQNLQYYEKKNEEENIKEFTSYFIFLCNFINKKKNYTKENKLIEYNKYFYLSCNLYYQYLNLLDFLVKIIIFSFYF